MNEPADPYTPPQSVAEVSPVEERQWKGKRVDQVMRWLCAGSLGTLMLQSLLSGAAMSPTKATAVVLWSSLGLGALFGGRRWHLGLAILMLLFLGAQLWGVKVYLEMESRLSGATPPGLWNAFARSLVACAVTLGCSVALYVRAGKVPGDR